MPQVFQVLCCYSCEMFQVHQVKKSNKWQCRVCNEKQSLKKAFKIGSSRDCRFLVQELNMQKSGLQQVDKNSENLEHLGEEIQTHNSFDSTEQQDFSTLHVKSSDVSDEKWLEENYVTENDRAVSNSLLEELCEENVIASADNILKKNSTFTKSSQYKENFDVLARTSKSVALYEPILDGNVNFRKSQKRTLGTDVDIPHQKVTPPPFKKNRGFQLIVNAASKLK